MRHPSQLAGRATGWLLLAASLLALACGEGRGPADARPLVAVSVVPLEYVVDRLAGERVRVEVMIPPGASPASFEPTLAQLRALSEADLYVKVGHPHFAFEQAWLERMLAESPDLRVVDASAGIADREGDPHVWVAPRDLERMAEEIAAALTDLLPDSAEALAANLESLRAEARGLDAEIREILAGAEGRVFYVFHPAWGHFAEAYALEQVAIEHDQKPPDAHELARLIERARADGVRVVFVQPQFDPSAAETLAREIGARVEPLDPLAYEWSANLRRVARAIAGSAGP